MEGMYQHEFDIRVIQNPNNPNNNKLIGCTIPEKNRQRIFAKMDNGVIIDGVENCLIMDNKSKRNKNTSFKDCIKCIHCNEDIFGSIWYCLKCVCIFCVQCYLSNIIHPIEHNFIRFDCENDCGIFVGKRLHSKDVQEYYGINVGSKVIEITSDNIKEVLEFEYKNELPRSHVKLKLKKSGSKIVMYGYEGNVDLRLNPRNMKDAVNKYYINPCQLQMFGKPSFYNYVIKEKIKDIIYKPKHITEIKKDDKVTLKLSNFNSDENIDESLLNFLGFIGTVIDINDDTNMTILFDKDPLQINKHLVYKLSDDEKLVQINCTKEIFIEAIKALKFSLELKEWQLSWILDENDFEWIRNKIGVAQKFTESSLNIVKYFINFEFQIILPANICVPIKKDRASVLEESKEINEYLNSLVNLIKHDDLEKLENEICKKGITEHGKLLYSCIKNNAIKCFKYISKLSYDHSQILKAVCLIINDESISPETLKFLEDNIDFEKLTKKEIEHKSYVDIISTNLDICKLIYKKNKALLTNNLLLSCLLNEKYDIIEWIKEEKHFKISGKCNEGEMKNYKIIKDDTILHVIIRYGFMEQFCWLIDRYIDDIDINATNKLGNSIFHEITLFNDGKKWKNFIDNSKCTLINEYIKEIKECQEKEKCLDKEKISLSEIPSVVLVIIIFIKKKDSYHSWHAQLNNKNKKPLECLSYEDIKINNFGKILKLLYLKLGKLDEELCKFCKADIISVQYLPCKHEYNCLCCAFVRYDCDCGQLINSKEIIIPNLKNSYDSFMNEDIPYRNLTELWEENKKLQEERICKICHHNKWDVIKQSCGHVFCKECVDKQCHQCRIVSEDIVIK